MPKWQNQVVKPRSTKVTIFKSQVQQPKPRPQVEKPRYQNQVDNGVHVHKIPKSSRSQVYKPKLVNPGILMKEHVLTEYSDVFEGLGRFPGEPYQLRLKPNSQHAKHRPRKVPLHLQEAFHEEVARLVKIDVLEPVKELTEWVNSYVIAEKDVQTYYSNAHRTGHSIRKKLCLCLDPKDLNKALKREPYYCRTMDELIAKFHGAKVLIIVDLNKGYWQVELHADSREISLKRKLWYQVTSSKENWIPYS